MARKRSFGPRHVDVGHERVMRYNQDKIMEEADEVHGVAWQVVNSVTAERCCEKAVQIAEND